MHAEMKNTKIHKNGNSETLCSAQSTIYCIHNVFASICLTQVLFRLFRYPIAGQSWGLLYELIIEKGRQIGHFSTDISHKRFFTKFELNWQSKIIRP